MSEDETQCLLVYRFVDLYSEPLSSSVDPFPILGLKKAKHETYMHALYARGYHYKTGTNIPKLLGQPIVHVL